MDNILDYDLKLEMYNIKRKEDVKRLYEDTKISKVYSFEQLFEKEECDVKDYSTDKYLIRYMLFKYINNKDNKISFDCDKTNIVKDYYKKFNENNLRYAYHDTYYSMQTLWREVVKLIDETKGNDFRWQLDNFELIKDRLKSLGTNTSLYDVFAEFAYRFHTIPNIAPCPNPPFNTSKGSFDTDILDMYGNVVRPPHSRYYDRLDLFLDDLEKGNNKLINEDKRENILEWFRNNTKKFHLEEFVNNDLPSKISFPETSKDTNEIDNLIAYIKQMLDIIYRRKDKMSNDA